MRLVVWVVGRMILLFLRRSKDVRAIKCMYVSLTPIPPPNLSTYSAKTFFRLIFTIRSDTLFYRGDKLNE